MFCSRKCASCWCDQASSGGCACSAALCQLSQWLVSTAWWMSHCRSHHCSTPILVSNIPCWMEAKNPTEPSFGSRLLFCFLPFYDSCLFPVLSSLSSLVIYGDGHYVALTEWITTYCSESAPFWHFSVCRIRLVDTMWCKFFSRGTFAVPQVVCSHHKGRLWDLVKQAGSYWCMSVPSLSFQATRVLGL